MCLYLVHALKRSILIAVFMEVMILQTEIDLRLQIEPNDKNTKQHTLEHVISMYKINIIIKIWYKFKPIGSFENSKFQMAYGIIITKY